MTTISLSKLRPNLSNIIERIALRHNKYIIKKGNIPVTVMVNYQEYKELLDELEDLRLACDPEVLEDVRITRKEHEAGKTKDFDNFAKELGL